MNCTDWAKRINSPNRENRFSMFAILSVRFHFVQKKNYTNAKMCVIQTEVHVFHILNTEKKQGTKQNDDKKTTAFLTELF